MQPNAVAEASPPEMLDASKLENVHAGCTPRIPRLARKACSAKRARRLLHPAVVTLKANTKQYCSSAAIHGVRYIVEEGRTLFERVFWVISLAASLVGCTIMIYKLYDKWGSDPVIVAPAEKPRAIWDVPFPAVTVCPVIKWPVSEFNYTAAVVRFVDYLEARVQNDSTVSSPSEHELNMLASAALICPYGLVVRGILRRNNVTVTNQNSLLTLLKMAYMHEHSMSWAWGDTDSGAYDAPQRTITEDGTCFTYNMLNNQELFKPEAAQYHEQLGRGKAIGWNTETWSPDPECPENITYPRRTRGDGERFGMSLSLPVLAEDIDVLCTSTAEHGYKVILHSPADYPRSDKQYHRVSLKQSVHIFVKPAMTTTAKSLTDYSPPARKCYRQDEGGLQFFKVYTQQNCELECLAQHTVQKCQCAAFYMPRSANTSICLQDLPCLWDIFDEMGKVLAGCDCQPSCTTLEYDVHTTHTDYERLSDLTTLQNAMVPTVSSASVYFKVTQFIPSERRPNDMYGLTDFLASCGGLLSLFNGFSLISLVEIVYYATIRLWCNLYRRRTQAVGDLPRPRDVEKQQ